MKEIIRKNGTVLGVVGTANLNEDKIKRAKKKILEENKQKNLQKIDNLGFISADLEQILSTLDESLLIKLVERSVQKRNHGGSVGFSLSFHGKWLVQLNREEGENPISQEHETLRGAFIDYILNFCDTDFLDDPVRPRLKKMMQGINL